jgi:hypothetical protein
MKVTQRRREIHMASKGQAARRRDGDPSNAYGDLGNGGRSHQTHEEALDQAVLANSPRVAMGSSAYAMSNSSGAPSPNTLPRPKAKAPGGTCPGSVAAHVSRPNVWVLATDCR